MHLRQKDILFITILCPELRWRRTPPKIPSSSAGPAIILQGSPSRKVPRRDYCRPLEVQNQAGTPQRHARSKWPVDARWAVPQSKEGSTAPTRSLRGSALGGKAWCTLGDGGDALRPHRTTPSSPQPSGGSPTCFKGETSRKWTPQSHHCPMASCPNLTGRVRHKILILERGQQRPRACT